MFEDVEFIELLLNADAVEAVQKTTDFYNNLIDIKTKATVNVCNNALSARNIDSSIVSLDFNVVPSGVYFIAEQQQKGFLYIKV